MSKHGSARRRPEASSSPRLLFVSTYPPTRCGLANYTQSLVRALSDHRGGLDGLGVVRLMPPDDPPDENDDLVMARVVPGRPGWLKSVRAASAGFHILCLQHEYGIFGPDDGLAVLDLIESVDLPVMLTLHTVPRDPSDRQRQILESLVTRAEVLVVMSHAARRRLELRYRFDGTLIRVIPHGAHGFHGQARRSDGRPTILTWGLIGPGKGIEWAIHAMRKLRHLEPLPWYLVQGGTHPNVRRRQGETYRRYLEWLVRSLGVEHMVDLEDGYVDDATLGRMVAGADVVLLPYDSRDQVTSGVLIEAVAAGKPVVATAFPHAMELLSGGAGVVVPHQDPDAIAEAVARLLGDRRTLSAAQEAARHLAGRLEWGSVAAAYEEMVARVARAASGAA